MGRVCSVLMPVVTLQSFKVKDRPGSRQNPGPGQNRPICRDPGQNREIYRDSDRDSDI